MDDARLTCGQHPSQTSFAQVIPKREDLTGQTDNSNPFEPVYSSKVQQRILRTPLAMRTVPSDGRGLACGAVGMRTPVTSKNAVSCTPGYVAMRMFEFSSRSRVGR